MKPQDLNSINNLNHYIGMKTISPEAIPELHYMPWLIGGLILVMVVAVTLYGHRIATSMRRHERQMAEARDAAALKALVDGWKSGKLPLPVQDRDVLTRALRAFRKSLKVTRLARGVPAGSGRAGDGPFPQRRWPHRDRLQPGGRPAYSGGRNRLGDIAA